MFLVGDALKELRSEIHQLGYDAFINGKRLSHNPFLDEANSKSWVDGFNEARKIYYQKRHTDFVKRFA